MSTKLKLSKESSNKLDYLSNRVGLRRNLLCRIAMGKAIAEGKLFEKIIASDSAGYEFNRYTLTGDRDELYKALVVQHENKIISEEEYLPKYLKYYIEEGLHILHSDFQRINSPSEFLLSLFQDS